MTARAMLLQFSLIFSFYLVLVSSYEELSLSGLRNLTTLDTGRLSLNYQDPLNHFSHFNRTRTPGSSNSIYIQDYITNHFTHLNINSHYPWTIEKDQFVENGHNFTNIVVTKQPAQDVTYLMFGAHFDTLFKPEGFIGAIDSAVSCSILLDLADSTSKTLDDAFESEAYDSRVGLKLVFFDGEEALERWSPIDSIYGSRHLHQEWSKSGQIKDLELFVLLDLLGSDTVNYVPSYYPQTHDNYNDLSIVENRLAQFYNSEEVFPRVKFLSGPSDTFKPETSGYIEDDHIPFLRSGIPILHLIPHIFPKTWHTLDDNFEHISLPAVNKWNWILRAFIFEYLDVINVWLPI